MKLNRILPWLLLAVVLAAGILLINRQNQQIRALESVTETQAAAATALAVSQPTPMTEASQPPAQATPTTPQQPSATMPAESSPQPSPTSAATATSAPQASGPITPAAIPVNIVDHTALDLYDRIPPEYLREAEKIRMIFFDRSVGWNIDGALDCLAAPSWGQSPANCRQYFINDVVCAPSPANSYIRTYTNNDAVVPAPIRFPGGNNRSSIEYGFTEGAYWYEELEWFINNFDTYADRQIVTFGHNYLQVTEDSTIADVYFDSNYAGYNLYDLLELEAQHPDNTFLYWTSSLARTIGSSVSDRYNDQMRTWARDNNKILFDLAAILSHTPEGAACTNAEGHAVICCEYTSESDGGHLGSVSAGKIRAAKGLWVLLAQLAGWQP